MATAYMGQDAAGLSVIQTAVNNIGGGAGAATLAASGVVGGVFVGDQIAPAMARVLAVGNGTAAAVRGRLLLGRMQQRLLGRRTAQAHPPLRPLPPVLPQISSFATQ